MAENENEKASQVQSTFGNDLRRVIDEENRKIKIIIALHSHLIVVCDLQNKNKENRNVGE